MQKDNHIKTQYMYYLARLTHLDREVRKYFRASLKSPNRNICSCLTSHRQRGYLETAPPFTVPCEGREAL